MQKFLMILKKFATNSQIPYAAKQVLPPGYSYKCLEFQELPSECFTGAPQNSFYIKVSVGNITSKEDIDQWLHQFSGSSNIKYNSQAGYKRKEVKVVYACWYICQCKCKKLTKSKQWKKRLQGKGKRRGMGRIRKTLDVMKRMVSTCFPEQEIRRQTEIVRWLFEYTQRKSYQSYVKQNFGGTTIIVLTVFT